MDGRWNMDERRWREKVRRFEFEAKDLRTERDKLREELNIFLGKPSADEAIEQIKYLTEQLAKVNAQNTELYTQYSKATDEIKDLKHQVGGLKMTLGRYTKKDKN